MREKLVSENADFILQIQKMARKVFLRDLKRESFILKVIENPSKIRIFSIHALEETLRDNANTLDPKIFNQLKDELRDEKLSKYIVFRHNSLTSLIKRIKEHERRIAIIHEQQVNKILKNK